MLDQEITIVTKAAVFDLMRIFKSDEGKTYTVKEIEAILDAYVKKTEG